MNRNSNNLNPLTESDVNFFDLKLERNRILNNSPIKNKRINDRIKSKSPIGNINHIILDNNNNNKFFLDNSNLRNTHSKLNFNKNNNNNLQVENKTYYPAIAKKPLLTDSNFNKSNHNFKQENNIYLQNKLYKNKINHESKHNENLLLAHNNASNNNLNENLQFKGNYLGSGYKPQYDSKNALFSSVNVTSKNFNKTNNNFTNNSTNESDQNRKIYYSSQNNFLFSNQGNHKHLQTNNHSSTGHLFHKNNLIRNFPEIITEEKNSDDNYSVSKTEPYRQDNSDFPFESKNINNISSKNKLIFPKKITPSLILNTETNSNKLLLNKSNSEPICLSTLDLFFNGYEKAKAAKKRISTLIRSYAANTYQGLVRNYNEDRVSIILNISKPAKFNGSWPKCSFFAIYDGHGGSSCADFLRDNLHNYVIHDSNFPANVKEAIRNGFLNAENEFMNTKALNRFGDLVDRSGSCAIVVMLVDNTCYCANVGDSRAVMSVDQGKDLILLSNDHKPEDEEEKKRILKNGGKVYQVQTPMSLLGSFYANNNTQDVFIGPTRVLPGRLSVSRSFGDIEAKRVEFGGNPNVITAIPEIKVFELNEKTDFIILGCDGIFDQIKSEEAIESVWKVTKDEATKNNSVHWTCISGVDLIMKTTLQRKTLDNITLLIIAFENFEKKIFQIFEEHNKNRFTGNILKSREFHNKNDFSSTVSNLRVETESYTTKSKFRESNILAQEMPNIFNKNHYLNTVSNVNSKNEDNFNYISYNNEISNTSRNNGSNSLQNLIKNQIESNGKNKSRSVQKIQVFRNVSNNSSNEQNNYSYENTAHEIIAKNTLEIPMIDITKKLSANPDSKFNENINRNNFYRNLFMNKDTIKEQKSNTPLQLNTKNIPVKLISLDSASKKIKIPMKNNKNTLSLGMFNSSHNKI